MVLKFFGFALLYLMYIALVFVGLGLVVKYAYELQLENIASPVVLMIGLIIALMVLIGLPPVLFSLNNARASDSQQHVLKNAQAASATILEVTDTGLSLGHPDLGFVVRLRLRVEPTGQPAFETELEMGVSRLAVPQIGQRVSVKFDQSNRHKVVLVG